LERSCCCVLPPPTCCTPSVRAAPRYALRSVGAC
jgi:hypothetical protein